MRQVFFDAKPFDMEFLVRAGLVAGTCLDGDLDDVVAEEVSYFLDCAPAPSLTRRRSAVLWPGPTGMGCQK